MPTIRVSEAVLDAAIRKAVEAGMFPRRSTTFEADINREIMSAILHAAFTAAWEEEPDNDSVPRRDTRPSNRKEIRRIY